MQIRALFLVSLATMAGTIASATEAQVGRDPGLDAGTGTTAMHRAADAGDVALLAQRLAAGDAVDARDERARTPLHHAAIAGRLEAAAWLLDHGADPNAHAEGEMTPLHFAAMLAQPELAGLLT